MEKITIYLAGPYSDPNRKVREKRFYELTKMAGWIMKQGYTVLSPITHGHPIALVTKLPTDYEYWKKACESQMDACKILAVYQLDGFECSTGVASEYVYSVKRGQPRMIFKNKFDFKRQIKGKLAEYEKINS